MNKQKVGAQWAVALADRLDWLGMDLPDVPVAALQVWPLTQYFSVYFL